MRPEDMSHHTFTGIDAPNTTPVPDVYFDLLFPRLGKGSLKVLLYLVRRTFGFKRDSDTVSLSQICHGIRHRDGTILDRGTGLTRSTATAAIRDLEDMGVIVARRGVSNRGDPAVTHYTLRFRERMTLDHLLQAESPAQGYRFPGIDSPNTTPVPDIYFDLLLPDLGLAEWRVLLYVVRRTLGFKKLCDTISLDQFCTGITTRLGTRLDYGTGLTRSAVSAALGSLAQHNVLLRQRVRDAQGGDGVSVYSLTMHSDAREALTAVLGCVAGQRLANDDTMLGQRANRQKPMGVVQSDQGGGLQIDCPDTPGAALQTPMAWGSGRGTKGSGGLKPAGVGEADYPEEPKRTTPSTPDQPPVVQIAHPQETGKQKTDQQEMERDSVLQTATALLAQIASDLGVPGAASAYVGRLRDLVRSTGTAAPDLYDALIDAWKATRRKTCQNALNRPDAALAYFYTVLCDRLGESTTQDQSPEKRGVGNSQHASARIGQGAHASHTPHVDGPVASPAAALFPLQDPDFLQHVERHCGRDLPDQQPWQMILRGLADTLNRTNFTRWFTRTALVDSGLFLLIAVPDDRCVQWLATGLAAAIGREARVSGEERNVRFITLAELAG